MACLESQSQYYPAGFKYCFLFLWFDWLEVDDKKNKVYKKNWESEKEEKEENVKWNVREWESDVGGVDF